MLLAGSIHLEAVIAALQGQRPVFHSEADFQHAFAWAAHELAPSLNVRLETHPQPNVRLDLLLSRPDLDDYTAVELKYLTARWSGEVNGEHFALKNHGAQDERGYDVIKDIERVERFVAAHSGWNGIVATLTNDPSYWRPPRHTRSTNAQAFRLCEGNVLHGVRAWGPRTGAGTRKNREADLTLAGQYACTWTDYSTLAGERGRFRLLTFSMNRSSDASSRTG